MYTISVNDIWTFTNHIVFKSCITKDYLTKDFVLILFLNQIILLVFFLISHVPWSSMLRSLLLFNQRTYYCQEILRFCLWNCLHSDLHKFKEIGMAFFFVHPCNLSSLPSSLPVSAHPLFELLALLFELHSYSARDSFQLTFNFQSALHQAELWTLWCLLCHT